MTNHTNSQQPNSKPANKNVIWISGLLISTLLGMAVAWMGSSGSATFSGLPVFALVIAYAYLLNWLVFIPSFFAHTEKYFDLTGAVTYTTATVAAVALSGNLDLRAWIAAAVVIVWSVRLGTFLFRRVHRDGGDGRFDEMKYDFWQFLMTWTIQGLWVSLTAAAAFVVITSETRVPFGITGTIGLCIWIAGFLIEVVADQQKSNFKAIPSNRGKFINVGLWSWSRHPNYFGEIMLWTGVAIMSIPVLAGSRWFALVSPIFVFFLLTKVSGIPILRRRADERWGDEAEYQAYVRNTSLLIPLPPRT